MRCLFLGLIAVLVVGCQQATPPTKTNIIRNPMPAPKSQASDPGIMPSAAGGLAPVTNPEAVDGGGGGGTGFAAKDMARRAAANGGAPAGSEPTGEEPDDGTGN